jgi:hypothetical protein
LGNLLEKLCDFLKNPSVGAISIIKDCIKGLKFKGCTMVIVYIKHYLNKAGVEYFSNIWYPKVCTIIKKQPGFVAIKSHKDAMDHSCIHITVKFANADHLDAWVKTPEHGEVINLLDPYRTKAWEVFRTSGERQGDHTLTWEKIESASTN